MNNDKPETTPENRAGKIPLERIVMIFDNIVLVLAGFMWPPLGFKLRMDKFNREEIISYRKWYVDVVIPSRERWAEQRIEEFNKPSLFTTFIRS